MQKMAQPMRKRALPVPATVLAPILTILLAIVCLAGGFPLRCAADDLPQPPKPGSSRWGKDDQRGAANRLTPQKVLEAVQLIKKGRVYSLGRVYEESMPLFGTRSYTLLIPRSSPPIGKNRLVGNDEFVATQIGQVGTQFDGLGHVGIDGVFYNGLKAEEFLTPKGLTRLGIENVGVIFTRGLLLDIAGLKGKARLEKGHEISKEDLQRALRKHGLEIRPGDIVLIHTGWGSLWKVDNDLYNSGQPGIGVSAAKFLVQKQIVMVGADNWSVEVSPTPGDPDLMFPAHQILLTQNGIYTLENLDTSALARDKVYEFAFVFAPLRMKGATGSPGNPVAIH